MKSLVRIVAFLCLSLSLAFSQSTLNQPAFNESTVSFGLTPVTLPSFGSTLAGVESDTAFNFTNYNQIGVRTIISSSTYIGPVYNRIFPSVSSYLQNHTALTGNQFQVGLTVSGGIVEASKQQWGGDGGLFVNYAPSGSKTWAIAFTGTAAYLPGIANVSGHSGKWIPKVAIGPAFKF